MDLGKSTNNLVKKPIDILYKELNMVIGKSIDRRLKDKLNVSLYIYSDNLLRQSATKQVWAYGTRKITHRVFLIIDRLIHINFDI